MYNRRDFIKQIGMAGMAAAISPELLAWNERSTLHERIPKKEDMIWANLIHLSFNIWQDYTPKEYQTESYPSTYTAEEVTTWGNYFHPYLTCEKKVWDLIIKKMAASGMNMAVIDIGDGVQYESHPEISVKNAWTSKQLKEALNQMRKMGIEPIPKLNFSAGHKTWLGPYQYQISSPTYYEVCKDLIEEVIELFDKPRFLHLGMDEETCEHQKTYRYTSIRNMDLWWHDFLFLVEQVERMNVRSWIWSDKIWRDNTAEFLKKMPKTVLQSNWNYEENGLTFSEDNKPNDPICQAFFDLEEHGYDQVPTASLWLHGRWVNDDNFGRIVKHTKQVIAPERLKGFMQTTWMPCLQPCLDTHYRAIDIVKQAIDQY
jgi:hypothetical protein